MKITHFLYNAFIVEEKSIKVAIDPGQNLYLFNLSSLIPKEEWSTFTHVLVTHGDPDHYWHADRIALTASAPLIMNASMIKLTKSNSCILKPRHTDKLEYTKFTGKVLPIRVDEKINVDDAKIQGIQTTHGPIEVNFFGIKKQKVPGAEERVGYGAIGYKIEVNNKSIVNLGDTLLQREWVGLKTDVLMLPIGGLGNNKWTMDVIDALQAVKDISPKIVIPCHYNVPFLWKRKICPANDQLFKREVEKMGVECQIMHYGESITVN